MARRRLARTVLLLCGLLAAPSLPSSAQEGPAAEIRWRYEYGPALKEALEKNLPLVIDFGTSNCYWCKKLDESTFRDPKVIGMMNERFIPLKVDGEKEPTLVQVLRIMSYPTIVVAAPDKRILGTLEGFQDAEKLNDTLQRALVALTPSDWMSRDIQNAAKWTAGGDYARAIPTLKALLEDAKAKPMHVQAQKLLKEIEQKATQRLAHAKQLHDKGQLPEAIEALSETMRLFPGLDVTKSATAMLTQMVQNPEVRNEYRAKRARDLLGQARDYYANKEYIPCLDRCELLLSGYGDLPESGEASKLAAEIKSNPDWLQGACDRMGDHLGGLYLALAESLLKRGEPQRAEFYLQRVIAAFPGSRQAESAQIRLGQIQTNYPKKAEVQSAGQ
jgi:thioredoxin-like negative regulator of GroEL